MMHAYVLNSAQFSQVMMYRKRGKIRWAKLSRFSGVPRKFFRKYKCLSSITLNNEYLCTAYGQGNAKIFPRKLLWCWNREYLAQLIFPRLRYNLCTNHLILRPLQSFISPEVSKMYVTLQCCIVNLKMDTRHIIVHFMAPRRSIDVMQSQFKSHEILKTLNELVYVKVAHHCYHFTSCKCIWSANSTGKQTSWH